MITAEQPVYSKSDELREEAVHLICLHCASEVAFCGVLVDIDDTEWDDNTDVPCVVCEDLFSSKTYVPPCGCVR